MFTNPKVPYEPEGDNAGTGEEMGHRSLSNGTYSDGLVNIDTLITLVDDYSDLHILMHKEMFVKGYKSL